MIPAVQQTSLRTFGIIKMKSIFVHTIFAILFGQMALAQRDLPAVPDKFLTAAKKDTAYLRFQTELNALIKKAKGRTTYATEAASLFAQNKNLLERVNRQYNRGENMNRSGFKPLTLKINPEILKLMTGLAKVNLQRSFEKPYKNWGYVHLANASTAELLQNDLQNGEIDFSVYASSPWAPSFKDFHRGFRAVAKVPNDPDIIAAQVHFEYSFYYTGWDTYGASNGMQLVFGPSKNFISQALNSSTDTAVFAAGYNIPPVRFTILGIMLPWDSISTEIKEMHADQEGAFSITGYVKPNETVDFAIGVGYMHGSVYGINGHYLYGEFRLKKATITYLKTSGD